MIFGSSPPRFCTRSCFFVHMYLTGKFLTSFKAQRAKKAMTAKKEKKKAKKAMKANERDEVHVESIALDQEINEFFDWLVADD